MKNSIHAISILICIALLATLSASKKSEPRNELFLNYAHDLEDKIEKLQKTAEDFRYDRKDAQTLQQSVRETRNAYKKLSFLLSFYYPSFDEGHLNGAPILKIKREGARAVVTPPEGLQVIDELAFLDAEAEKVLIHQLSQKLDHSYDVLLVDLERKDIPVADLIPAMRKEIVSILTLSLTGFDTPGSLNGIEESKQSLHTIQTFLKEYFGDNSRDLSMKIQFAKAYLERNNDFDSLDRLFFLKEHLNPIYRDLLELARENEIAIHDVYGPWNTGSENIFAADFLDPYFFTELEQGEDSPVLRELGKTLFYDKSLSKVGDMSCGSCHKPELAFTDGKPRSDSNVEGKTVLRNAPTLLNAAYADRYFYDLRAFTLEQQAEHVIFNSEEFNSAYSQIISRLEARSDYRDEFKEAFGDKEISRERLVKALSSYVLSLQSFNSPFDEYVRGERSDVSAEVREGFNLFMGKAACGTCHFAPTFAGLVPPSFIHSESEILGVLENPHADSLDADMGRNANGISNESAWIYDRSFKTMTVRNVELTAPYFHNGAYSSLNEVLDFYNEGGGEGKGLTVSNQTLAPDPLNLSDDEMNAIIAFMKSLTDNSAAELDYAPNQQNNMVNNSN